MKRRSFNAIVRFWSHQDLSRLFFFLLFFFSGISSLPVSLFFPFALTKTFLCLCSVPMLSTCQIWEVSKNATLSYRHLCLTTRVNWRGNSRGWALCGESVHVVSASAVMHTQREQQGVSSLWRECACCVCVCSYAHTETLSAAVTESFMAKNWSSDK